MSLTGDGFLSSTEKSQRIFLRMHPFHYSPNSPQKVSFLRNLPHPSLNKRVYAYMVFTAPCSVLILQKYDCSFIFFICIRIFELIYFAICMLLYLHTCGLYITNVYHVLWLLKVLRKK